MLRIEALPSAVKRGVGTTGPAGASLRAALNGETEQQKDALSGSLQRLGIPGPFSPSLPSSSRTETSTASKGTGLGRGPGGAHPRGPRPPAGPPCPCARGFGCGSTGRCCKPGCGPPGQGGGAAGASPARPHPVSPACLAPLPKGLAARQRRGGWDSGQAAASGGSVPGSALLPFDPASQEAPPLQARLVPPLALFVWEKHPHGQPVGYGNPDASRFPSRAQKSHASFSRGWFPAGQFRDAE